MTSYIKFLCSTHVKCLQNIFLLQDLHTRIFLLSSPTNLPRLAYIKSYTRTHQEELSISHMCFVPVNILCPTYNFARICTDKTSQVDSHTSSSESSVSLEEEEESLSKDSETRELASKFPMLAISAINEVLFEHQGYQGRPSQGDVRSEFDFSHHMTWNLLTSLFCFCYFQLIETVLGSVALDWGFWSRLWLPLVFAYLITYFVLDTHTALLVCISFGSLAGTSSQGMTLLTNNAFVTSYIWISCTRF